MCGRYALTKTQRDIESEELFSHIRSVDVAFDQLPHYNISPMQKAPVIAIRDGELVLQNMQWWLIPHWSKSNKPSFSTFNAKSETLDQSKLFVSYFKGSRCLVPADAFYEWQKVAVSSSEKPQKKKEEKQPCCIRMKDESLFMFAGLFSVWKDAEGHELPTFTILTTEPNDLMRPIHNRMPVILPPDQYEPWLDRTNKDIETLKKSLVPYAPDKMKAYHISNLVNSPKNDSAECLHTVEKD
ncbi:MAG: SOS response-associated peptidase [bacterium]